jgi:hypothetical protein
LGDQADRSGVAPALDAAADLDSIERRANQRLV